ncbi:MAG: hypothetical protein KGJ86_00600 [Chloroflexota bacterium]|nr:hypothetical protein [Chloroflexota bacterium]
MEVLNRTYGPPGYDLSPEGGASAETNAVPVEDRIKALHARYADPDAAPPKPKSPVVDLPEDGTLQPAPPPTPMPADAFAPVEDSPGEEPPSAGPDTMGQQEVI